MSSAHSIPWPQRLWEPRQQIPAARKRFSDRDLCVLIVPILVEQFLAMLVGIADTLMVSYAGEAAVSAVALVNQLNNVFILVFSALASGGAVVASQYVGSEDPERGDLAASQLVMLTAVIAFAMTAVVLAFGRQIFGLLFGRVEPDVFAAGMTYLRISAWSFPFLAVYNGCAGLFRSMNRSGTLMNVSIVMNAINVAGNAIGVFALHAGVAGVAYPSLISRAFAAVVMLYLAMQPGRPLRVHPRQIFAWRGRMVRRIFHVAVPGGIENGLFQISKVALSSIVALFGTVQIAANGVAQSFWSMSALFCIGMGPAFITVIGQYMGAGDVEGAEYYMKKLLRLTYLGAVVWTSFFSALLVPLLALYSLSDEACRLTVIMVLLHNVFNVLICPVAFSLTNGLRAAGDIRYATLAAIFSTVVCRVAASWFLGIVLDLGAIGITLAMIVDWGVHALLVWLRYRSGKWKSFTVI